MFRIGQKVVCVVASGTFLGVSGEWDDLLEKGKIYTVRWIGPADYYGINFIGVRLDGIRLADPWDSPFHISRFHPVVERKTDISIFTAMLNPSKQGVDA